MQTGDTVNGSSDFFAALEQPALLVEDVRNFFRKLAPRGTGFQPVGAKDRLEARPTKQCCARLRDAVS
jgi:hypothetical protein